MFIVFAPNYKSALQQVPQIRSQPREYMYASRGEILKGYARGESTTVIYLPLYHQHSKAEEIEYEIMLRGYGRIHLKEGEIWQDK